jgi:hypothetical protein
MSTSLSQAHYLAIPLKNPNQFKHVICRILGSRDSLPLTIVATDGESAFSANCVTPRIIATNDKSPTKTFEVVKVGVSMAGMKSGKKLLLMHYLAWQKVISNSPRSSTKVETLSKSGFPSQSLADWVDSSSTN